MSAPLLSTPKYPHAVFVHKMVEYMQHRKSQSAHRSTIRALNSLGQGALKDLAIDRTEINSIVYSAPQERRRSYSD